MLQTPRQHPARRPPGTRARSRCRPRRRITPKTLWAGGQSTGRQRAAPMREASGFRCQGSRIPWSRKQSGRLRADGGQSGQPRAKRMAPVALRSPQPRSQSHQAPVSQGQPGPRRARRLPCSLKRGVPLVRKGAMALEDALQLPPAQRRAMRTSWDRHIKEERPPARQLGQPLQKEGSSACHPASRHGSLRQLLQGSQAGAGRSPRIVSHRLSHQLPSALLMWRALQGPPSQALLPPLRQPTLLPAQHLPKGPGPGLRMIANPPLLLGLRCQHQPLFLGQTQCRPKLHLRSWRAWPAGRMQALDPGRQPLPGPCHRTHRQALQAGRPCSTHRQHSLQAGRLQLRLQLRGFLWHLHRRMRSLTQSPSALQPQPRGCKGPLRRLQACMQGQTL